MKVVPRFGLALSLAPRWESVPKARAATMEGLASAFEGRAPDDYVGMIVSELLENAVRYGEWRAEPDAEGTMWLRVSANDDAIEIVVSSPSSAARVEPLLRMLAWIRGFPTAREAYEARVRELAESRVPPNVSRLGLVRVLAEGRCDLEASIDDRCILHVRAIVRAGRTA
jgi:hypothetical protein